MKKVLKALLIVAISLIALVFIICNLLFKMPVWNYYQASERTFSLPDIHSGFIPQGFEYVETDGNFLVTGYMNDGSASPVYVLDKEGNILSKVSLPDKEGHTITSHNGGISIYKDFVYVAGGQDCCVNIYSYEDILNGSPKHLGVIDLKFAENDYLGPAFVTASEGKLIIGEFYRLENYPTCASHQFTTSAGGQNHALAIVYELGDYPNSFGYNPASAEIWSIPDLTQGIAFKDGKIYTSASYAVAKSDIRVFDYAKANSGKTIDLLGQKSAPLYELDSNSLENSYLFAPMAEEITFVDGCLYTMCESASNKYIFGKFTGHTKCYATDLTKM